MYKNITESSSVKFLGSWDNKTFLKNIYDYHVFVLPSYGEGMPLAAMEAMASGRALICSRVPGCNACIIEGKNGFFCEPSSSDSLKQSIQKIIQNKNLIPVMGNYSRKLVEKDLSLKPICEDLCIKLNKDIKLVSKNIKQINTEELFNDDNKIFMICSNLLSDIIFLTFLLFMKF